MHRSAVDLGTATAPAVDVAPTASGLRLLDRNARERCHLGVDGVEGLRSVEGSIVARAFPVPVETAVELRADGLTLPDAPATVRDRDGGHVARIADVAFRTFPRGRYLLELHGAVPCVLAFEGGFTLAPDERGISFEEPTTVRVGARSAQPRPTATVTTTDGPEDLMAAISTFGSAATTRGPERSLPAFRRHPPALARGDELRIPDGLEPPETGPTIELPPERAYAYAAAPLATYLGATVEPAERAHLVAGDVSYALSGRGGVEDALARVLKRTLTLDSICRGAGPYPGESHEARAVEAVDLDWERLYDADPVERLDAYLSMPYGEIEPAIPKWPTCAHVEPTPESLDAIPTLAGDLATIRSPPLVSSRRPGPTPWADADGPDEQVRPERSGAVEDAWFGEGTPLNATKGMAQSYRNRFDGSADRADAGVTVLAPDPEEVDAARDIGAAYDDPTVVAGLPRHELRQRLRGDAALLHLVGDVGADGVACADGWLDLQGFDGTVGCDLFVMDSCSAHGQATALVENGALGGVAAFHESPGERTDVGVALARLLADGFPLAGSVDLAAAAGFEEEGFLVAGDGASTLAGTGSRPPVALVAESLSSGYAVQYRGYATDTAGLGSRVRSPLDGRWALTAARRRPETLDADSFEALCEATERPVVVDGEFRR
ncbi:hypothetical protein JCM30237_14360 [Halolamina litorea]|uniref:Caspase domain-containing protein n=1 Tax=Halolamina litorea TaxID=1515593 RepID=A0ABD6BN80_9EURY|nr:hypothetical protein [Halolamina litorea]